MTHRRQFVEFRQWHQLANPGHMRRTDVVVGLRCWPGLPLRSLPDSRRSGFPHLNRLLLLAVPAT
jgi:hypothetical protein